MKSAHLALLVLTLVVHAAQTRAASPPELPLLYSYNSPLYDSAGDWTVTVYQGDDFSVAVHTSAEMEPVVQREDKAATLRSQTPAFAVGDRTGHRMAKSQRLNRRYFRIEQPQSLEFGKHYTEVYDPPDPREAPYEREWWVENLTVDWKRGGEDTTIEGLAAKHYVMTLSYDYHRIDHDDGERLDETVQSKRDFWFAEALPFSPLQMIPLRVIDDYRYVCYCSPVGGRINHVVDTRLKDELRDAGMLLRTRRYTDGEPGDVVEISGLRSGDGVQLDNYRQLPMIPASRETPAVGALMLQKMLADAPAEGAGTADIRLEASPAGTAQALSGISWFRVSPTGDFAIANILTTDSGGEGMLLLMRPYHGRPEAGSYSTRPQPERAELETLGLEALKERAHYFQAVGLVEEGDKLMIYTGTGDGEISITSSAEQRIEGEIALEMDAIDTFGSGEVKRAVVSGQFGANDGLRARMRSVLGRLIERQQ